MSEINKGFDFVVKGDVKIVKKSKHDYKIKFFDQSDVLAYQVWSKIFPILNQNREIGVYKAKNAVKFINNISEKLKTNSSISYTPTTVMEIGNDKYVFIINKFEYRDDKKKYKFIMHVSTNYIENKKFTKIQKGKHYNVRFDVDNVQPHPPAQCTSHCVHC